MTKRRHANSLCEYAGRDLAPIRLQTNLGARRETFLD